MHNKGTIFSIMSYNCLPPQLKGKSFPDRDSTILSLVPDTYLHSVSILTE